MALIKTHKKAIGRPRKVATKRGVPKKGNLEAINKALAIVDKYNIDFNYLKQ